MTAIALVDYGVGNLRSAQKALEAAGADRVVVTRDPAVIRAADRVVLPGVGAYGHCIGSLRDAGLEEPVLAAIASGRPFLGVCVGMQLLFEQGEEFGVHRGFGILPGRVVHLGTAGVPAAGASADGLKIPHMGWSPVTPVLPGLPPLAAGPPGVPAGDGCPPARDGACPLFSGIAPGTHFYFVHSYVAVDVDPRQIAGWTTYGVRFPAAVAWRNVAGTQFHPEKSQAAGLALLRNFLGWRP